MDAPWKMNWAKTSSALSIPITVQKRACGKGGALAAGMQEQINALTHVEEKGIVHTRNEFLKEFSVHPATVSRLLQRECHS